MKELREFLYETPVLVAVLLISLTLGIFGAANWNCYVTPSPVQVPSSATKEQFEAAQESYRERLEESRRGRGALMPFVFAMPLTFVGLGGACVVVATLMYKYKD